MYVIAIGNAEGDPALLASILGLVPFEARAHLQCGSPRVVGVRSELEDARALAAPLFDAGFDPMIIGEEDLPSESAQYFPRSFEFQDGTFAFYLRDGQGFGLPFADVTTLIRGTMAQMEEHSEIEVKKVKSRARKMMSGGMLRHKTEVNRVTTTTDKREGFLVVIPKTGPSVFLKETALVYDGMGAAKQATRMANFNALVQTLRDHAPQAPFDDRLLMKPGQTKVLGSLLSPVDDIDIAIALVARHLTKN